MASCVAQIRAAGSSAATPTRRVALRARNAAVTTTRASRSHRTLAIMTEAETAATDEVQAALKSGGVTVEYQRKQAKEMVKFFKTLQYDQAVEESQVFGWTSKNEINNGRWTMFGLLVGMLTEFATGVDFIDQVKLTISVLGIADIYD